MSEQSTTVPWSFRECRTAAAAVGAQRRGRRAIKALRGRAVSGVHAEHAPLPLLLWLASRQGRLATAPGGSFALLRPPARTTDERHARFDATADDRRSPTRRAGRWLAAKLARHWQHVAGYGPVIGLLLVAAALALTTLTTVAIVVILVFAVVGVVWPLVMVSLSVVGGMRELRRQLEGRTALRAAVTDRATSEHWTIALSHAAPGDVDRLLEQAIGLHEGLTPTGLLLVSRVGVTTDDALAAVESSPFITRPDPTTFDDDLLVLVRRTSEGRAARPAHEPVKRPTGGITIFLGAVLTVLPLFAVTARSVDGAVCVDPGCAPPSYLQTVMWMFDQYLPFGGPAPGVAAGSWVGWLYGELVAVLGLVSVLVVVGAMADVRRFNREVGPFADARLSVELSNAEREQFGGVFLNYRIDGSRSAVRRLRESLVDVFHADKVFLDEKSMPPGSIYPAELRDGLARSEVLVVVIHPEWLAMLKAPGATDWVQREIHAALGDGKLIIPVLLDDASMPTLEELPPDIREFALRQAAAIRADSAGRDVTALVDHIASKAQRRPRPVGGT